MDIIQIEIAWIDSAHQGCLCSMRVPEGYSILAALTDWSDQSIDWAQQLDQGHLALWDQRIKEDQPCAQGIRIHWLKPLLCDPKEQRRRRQQRS